jgi:hypothetical protein
MYILSRIKDLCVRLQTGYGLMDSLTTFIQHSELYFADYWHTQTSVLSVLWSPLAVSWQQLLPREILQLPTLRSSSHSRTCRSVLNSLTTQPATLRHFPQLNSWQLSTNTNSFSKPKSKWSYFTTGGLPPVSLSWRQAPWGPRPEIFSNWTLAVIVLM